VTALREPWLSWPSRCSRMARDERKLRSDDAENGVAVRGARRAVRRAAIENIVGGCVCIVLLVSKREGDTEGPVKWWLCTVGDGGSRSGDHRVEIEGPDGASDPPARAGGGTARLFPHDTDVSSSSSSSSTYPGTLASSGRLRLLTWRSLRHWSKSHEDIARALI